VVTHLQLCGPYTRVHCLNSPPYLQVAINTESALARMMCFPLTSYSNKLVQQAPGSHYGS